jgi:hypothetical protein
LKVTSASLHDIIADGREDKTGNTIELAILLAKQNASRMWQAFEPFQWLFRGSPSCRANTDS